MTTPKSSKNLGIVKVSLKKHRSTINFLMTKALSARFPILFGAIKISTTVSCLFQKINENLLL